jgi:hypothetical protein
MRKNLKVPLFYVNKLPVFIGTCSAGPKKVPMFSDVHALSFSKYPDYEAMRPMTMALRSSAHNNSLKPKDRAL